MFLPVRIFSQQYYFKRYTSWDGLVQNTIRTLHQDDIGRIWIGTAEGVSIYDGNEFSNYSKKEGLGGNVIECFFQINSTTIWVGTEGGGISVLRKPKLQSDTVIKVLKGKKYLINNSVNKIYKDSKGRIWFCTNGGITRWSNSNIDSCTVTNFDKKSEPGHIFINTVSEDNKGNIWFGSDHGLIKYKHRRFNFIKGYSKDIWEIKSFSKDSLWLGTNRGILIYSEGKFIKPFKNPHLASTEVNYISRDKYSNIWIATDNGLFLYDGKKLKNFSLSNGAQNKFILSFLEDKEGDTWIGTVDGLYQLLNRNFYYYDAKFKYSYLWKIIPLGNGKVYAATKDGFYRIKKNKLVLASVSKILPTKSVTNAIFEKDGTRWFSTNIGLFRIKDGKITSFTKKNGFDSNYILSMIKGGKDSIWVGTKGYWKPHLGRVFLIKSGKVIQPNVLKKLSPDPVTSLCLDKSHNLWIGFYRKGLYELTGNKLKTFTSQEGLYDKNIRDIFQDRGGNIWVMTRYTGVYIYKDGRFKHFDEKDGLTSNWVMTAIQDKSGNIWFNTAKGVCSFDGKKFHRFNDGGNLMSGEMWASAMDKQGKLWFGNANYIFVYKPTKERRENCPLVYFKKFILNNKQPKEIPKNHALNFNYYNNAVEIDYSDVNYNSGKTIYYQYKLDGLDDNWNPLTKRNYVLFNHLPAGNYRFFIRAKYDGGFWSKVNSNIAFTIVPPIWQRWWFELFSAVFAVVIVSLITILIYRYRVSQLLKLERIRTKIATDLHDDIGANLSTISIFAELANQKINDAPDKASQLIYRIGNMARELVDSMSDIVWAINPETDSLSEMILKMKNFAFEILQAKGINIYFTLDKELPEVKFSMEERRNLLLIFKECINNAAKYSEAKMVKVTINIIAQKQKAKRNFLKLSIIDNGCGFDQNNHPKGNGLKNINKRAKEINAEVSLFTKNGNGTSWEFMVPIEL